MTQPAPKNAAEFPDNPHFPPSREEDRRDLMALEMTSNQMLAPQTLGQALEWARILCDAEIVPKQFRGKPADVLTCLLFGRNLGLDVVQSLQNVAVVNGKATVYGDALLGIVLAKLSAEERADFLEHFTEEWDPTAKQATCAMRRGKRERVVTFSIADAEKIETIETSWEGVAPGGRPNKKTIKLSEKDTYRNYPRRMCKFKARNEALRDLYPDLLLGILPREDAEDYYQRDAVDGVGYTVERDGQAVRVEGLEDLLGELEPETASQIASGFDRLVLSRAQRLVKLREFRGRPAELLASLRDEFALQATRGAQHYRPKDDKPEATAARREAAAKRIGDGLDAALQARQETSASAGQASGQSQAEPSASAAATPAATTSTNAPRVLF